MGKNSAKKAAKIAAKFAKKASLPNKIGSQVASVGSNSITTIEAPPVVSTTKTFGFAAPVPKPEVPVIPPVVVKQVDSKKMEGYILDTAYTGNGSIKYTKVLVDNNGWDVILCKDPATTMKPGTLITFTPGEYQGRMTVLAPYIVDENTPLAKFFLHCGKKASEIHDVSIAELGKKYMSTNHVGKDDVDKFNNFLAGVNILEIVGELEGRFIYKK